MVHSLSANTHREADEPVVGWQPMVTAPHDRVIIAMARYRDAAAGYPRFVAFLEGCWREPGRTLGEPLECWAWMPRDALGEWPLEDDRSGQAQKGQEAFAHKSAEEIAAEAYQVIGAIAGVAGLFDHPDVQRAIDYFADPKGEILPFAAEQAGAGVGWLPIETAPRDAVLLLYGPIGHGRDDAHPSGPIRACGYWDGIDEAWAFTDTTWGGPFMDPTHWMPLPAPPTTEASQAQDGYGAARSEAECTQDPLDILIDDAFEKMGQQPADERLTPETDANCPDNGGSTQGNPND